MWLNPSHIINQVLGVLHIKLLLLLFTLEHLRKHRQRRQEPLLVDGTLLVLAFVQSVEDLLVLLPDFLHRNPEVGFVERFHQSFEDRAVGPIACDLLELDVEGFRLHDDVDEGHCVEELVVLAGAIFLEAADDSFLAGEDFATFFEEEAVLE